MWNDYVYYLKVNGELIDDIIFESEEMAKEFAEIAQYENYEIIEWDVA